MSELNEFFSRIEKELKPKQPKEEKKPEPEKSQPKEKPAPKDKFEQEYDKMYLRAVVAEKKLKALEQNAEEADKYQKRISELEGFNREKSEKLKEHEKCSVKISDLRNEIKQLQDRIEREKKSHETKQNEHKQRLTEIESQIDTKVQEKLESLLKEKDEECTATITAFKDKILKMPTETLSCWKSHFGCDLRYTGVIDKEDLKKLLEEEVIHS